MSVDHHAFVIFAKSQQYVERYTEIKVSGRNSLRIPIGIPQNHASVGWHCYIVFERASYAHVSVMINLHTVEFISNLIEYERDVIISQCYVNTLFLPLCGPLCSSSVFPHVQKAFVWQYVQILLLNGYSYFVAEHCVSERAVRVSQ